MRQIARKHQARVASVGIATTLAIALASTSFSRPALADGAVAGTQMYLNSQASVGRDYAGTLARGGQPGRNGGGPDDGGTWGSGSNGDGNPADKGCAANASVASHQGMTDNVTGNYIGELKIMWSSACTSNWVDVDWRSPYGLSSLSFWADGQQQFALGIAGRVNNHAWTFMYRNMQFLHACGSATMLDASNQPIPTHTVPCV